MESASSVTILTSGNSLGAYVPGIRLLERLRKRGVPAEFEVLERLFPEETRQQLVRTKQAFHASFATALMGTRLARGIGPSLADGAVDALLDRWQAEGRRIFLAVTGFWVPILEQYERRVHPEPIRAEFLRLDAIDTPSYRVYRETYPRFRHHWLFRLKESSRCFITGSQCPMNRSCLTPTGIGGSWSMAAAGASAATAA